MHEMLLILKRSLTRSVISTKGGTAFTYKGSREGNTNAFLIPLNLMAKNKAEISARRHCKMQRNKLVWKLSDKGCKSKSGRKTEVEYSWKCVLKLLSL